MKDPRTNGSAESGSVRPEAAEIRVQLDRLLASPSFAASPRRAQLLRYLVEKALEGGPPEISEYGIGVDVFGKPASFDPRIDSAIRSEISRLRQKLKDYYGTEGYREPLRIDLPMRSYVPEFLRRAEIPRPQPRRFPIRLLVAGTLAAAALAGLIGYWRLHGGSGQTIGSLVVLPFANMSRDSQNEYLADGLTEELTNDLAQWPDMRVVARTSAYAFKGKGVDVREIGRQLNVEAVIEGSVDKEGDRIRVTAQVNRASNGYHLWSKSFEGQSKDVMQLEDQMAHSIAEAVRGVGRIVPRAQPARATKNPEALDLYLQGNYQYSLQTPESYRKADDLCHAAAAKDPSYISAYLCIAQVENAMIHLTVQAPDEGFARMKAALDQALALDPDSAEAHGFLANIAYVHDWDWPRAEREYRFALEHGNQARTHVQYGWALATRGRFREAQEQFRIADDLDPLNHSGRFNEMLSYVLERNYAEAKLVLNRMLEGNPDELDAHAFLGLIAVYQHDCKAAEPELEWCARKSQLPLTKFLLAAGCACRGEDQQARVYLDRMEAVGPTFASPYQLALGYAFLHDTKRVLAYLQKSADAHEGQILYLKYDPAFDEMRNDPAFVAIEKRVGLI